MPTIAVKILKLEIIDHMKLRFITIDNIGYSPLDLNQAHFSLFRDVFNNSLYLCLFPLSLLFSPSCEMSL